VENDPIEDHQINIKNLEAQIDELRLKNEHLSDLIRKKSEIESVCADLQIQVDQKKKERLQTSREINKERASLQRLQQRNEKMLSTQRTKIFRQRAKVSKLEMENILKTALIERKNDEISRLANRIKEYENKRKDDMELKLTEFNTLYNSKHKDALALQCDQELNRLIDKVCSCREITNKQLRKCHLNDKPDDYDRIVLQVNPIVRDVANKTVHCLRPKLHFNTKFIRNITDGRIVIAYLCDQFKIIRDMYDNQKIQKDIECALSTISSQKTQLKQLYEQKQIWQRRYHILLSRCGSMMGSFAKHNQDQIKLFVISMIDDNASDISKTVAIRSLMKKMNIDLLKRPSFDDWNYKSTLIVYCPPTPTRSSQGSSELNQTDLHLSKQLLALDTPVGYYSPKRRRFPDE
ncbi:hypothetical protein GJ496_007253, partial [Pomphorhynchus laevis]